MRAPGHGVQNTLRLIVKKLEEGTLVNQTFLVMIVLLDCCGFQVADIYYLQDFPSGGYFDLTFRSMMQCVHVLKIIEEKEGKGPFSVLNAMPLFVQLVQTIWIVTIHMYSPHMTAAGVLTLLGRYLQVESSSNGVMDPFGIWTSKWQVK
eukprot:g39059.t1